MPFTISHIAAVLPLYRPLRRMGLMSAAAIGAMAPDFDLMLPWHLTRTQTHGKLALVTFALPVGLAVWVLFQLLIKPALIEVLPDRIYTRLRNDHFGPRLESWKTWMGAAVAIVLGAITHDIWDGFTHEDGVGVRMLPFLDDFGPVLGNRPAHLYRWLQHGSSVIGLALVLLAVWLWSHHAQKRNSATVQRRLSAAERHVWIAMYILIPVLLVGSAVLKIHLNGWPRLVSAAAITLFAVIAMDSSAWSLVIVSALLRRRLSSIKKSEHRAIDEGRNT